MTRHSIPSTGIAAALALASLLTSIPAYADCIVEGVAHEALSARIGDPTGPSLYIKKNPLDSFHYFVRLRDGRFIHEVKDGLGEVRVLVRGDVPACPTAGTVRDLGTVVGEPQVIEITAEVPARAASQRN